jgi:hypothetical protein
MSEISLCCLSKPFRLLLRNWDFNFQLPEDFRIPDSTNWIEQQIVNKRLHDVFS